MGLKEKTVVIDEIGWQKKRETATRSESDKENRIREAQAKEAGKEVDGEKETVVSEKVETGDSEEMKTEKSKKVGTGSSEEVESEMKKKNNLNTNPTAFGAAKTKKGPERKCRRLR